MMIQKMLLVSLVKAVVAMADPELLRQFVGTILCFIEKKVRGSASTVDDALVLPLCSAARVAFKIPEDVVFVDPDAGEKVIVVDESK